MSTAPLESSRLAGMVEDIGRALHIPPSQVLSEQAAFAMRELGAAETTVRTGMRSEPRPIGGWPEHG